MPRTACAVILALTLATGSAIAADTKVLDHHEIGRASCRERV